MKVACTGDQLTMEIIIISDSCSRNYNIEYLSENVMGSGNFQTVTK